MNTLTAILLAIVLVLIYCKWSRKPDTYANSPYTVPYMEEKISPMATFECIYPTIPLVVGASYSQT